MILRLMKYQYVLSYFHSTLMQLDLTLPTYSCAPYQILPYTYAKQLHNSFLRFFFKKMDSTLELHFLICFTFMAMHSQQQQRRQAQGSVVSTVHQYNTYHIFKVPIIFGKKLGSKYQKQTLNNRYLGSHLFLGAMGHFVTPN